MPAQIKRSDYAAMFGPTVGDKLRLADTDLIIEVERDLIAERSGTATSLKIRIPGTVWSFLSEPTTSGFFEVVVEPSGRMVCFP